MTAVTRILVLLLAVLGLSPVLAAQPRHAPHAVGHPRRPTPTKVAIDRNLSLEHECLNAVRATRAAPRLARPDAEGDSRRDAAAAHLDQAEQAAHAGHGQACQDELSQAVEQLQ